MSADKGQFTAAAVQMRSGMDPEKNARTFEALVREAAGQGATYIQSPEMTGALVRDRAALKQLIRPPERDIIAAAAARLAAELRVHIHVGSTPIAVDGGKVANRAFLFAPDGALVATYDKIHMFDVDLDEDTSYRESDTVAPGEDIVTVEVDGVTVGLAICYDLRFPELFRILTLRGADVIMLPAAFTLATGRDHWEPLIRARAIENQVFMVAAGQVGKHPPGQWCYGRSLIVDPWGVVMAQASDAPSVIGATLDLTQLERVRRQVPSVANRIPDRYRWPEPVGVSGVTSDHDGAG